ncbi:MAG: cysteine--tRNA ligase, partial [Pedobacter sp.]
AVSLLDKLVVSEQNDFDIDALKEKCMVAMNDDFNSPILIAELFEAVRIINTVYDGKAKISAESLEKLKTLINDFVFDILGLKDEDAGSNDLNGVLEMVIDLRTEAKANKDYATSDKIRIGLQELGIQLKDSKEGTTWNKA